MINEKKTHEMIQMAMYEQRDGGRDRMIAGYYKGDYISGKILESFFCATIAFVVFLALYGIYHFEEIIVLFYSDAIMSLLARILLIYLIFTGFYILITVLVYLHRYSEAVQDLRYYYAALKQVAGEDVPADAEE